MDKRTRILAGVFGAILAVVVFSRAIWPQWIAPLLDTETRLAELRKERDDLLAFDKRFQDAVMSYKGLAGRVGSMKTGDVRDDLHQRLGALLQKHRLAQGRISARSASTDRKNGWKMIAFNVSGEGTLLSALTFLRDLYELPHLLRVIDPRLTPQRVSRGQKKTDKVALSVTLQVLVLPSPAVLPRRLSSADLQQPDRYVRHRGVDLQYVSARQPFMEYTKPAPPRTDPKPTRQPTKVVKKDPVEPPPPEVDPRWKGRWRLVACWKDYSTSEIYWAKVEERSSRSSGKERDVAAGGDFDGGELLLVRQVGALVRRKDGDFVYPLGEMFTSAMNVQQADGYPRLQADALVLAPIPTPEDRPEEVEVTDDRGPPVPKRGRERSADVGPAPSVAQPTGDAAKRSSDGMAGFSKLFGEELQGFVEQQAREASGSATDDPELPEAGRSRKSSAGSTEKQERVKSNSGKPNVKNKKTKRPVGGSASGKSDGDTGSTPGEGKTGSTTKNAAEPADGAGASGDGSKGN